MSALKMASRSLVILMTFGILTGCTSPEAEGFEKGMVHVFNEAFPAAI